MVLIPHYMGLWYQMGFYDANKQYSPMLYSPTIYGFINGILVVAAGNTFRYIPIKRSMNCGCSEEIHVHRI